MKSFLLAACRPLKPFVPLSLRRRLLLHWLMRGEVRHVLSRPSRGWIEAVLLPTLAREVEGTVLSIGVAPYTWHYERRFRRSTALWVTNDIDPAAVIWGARRHILCPVQDIHHHLEPASVQAVVMNGMLGWGLDDAATYAAALEAIACVLVDGGVVFTGYYARYQSIADAALSATSLFVPGSAYGLGPRIMFPGEEYVFEAQARRPRLSSAHAVASAP